MCFGGGGSAEKMARQERSDEQARKRRIQGGMGQIDTTFSGFNEDFYNQRKQAYIDYAMPGVERQAGDARKGLIYALARTGNLGGSAANEKNADLNRAANDARIGVANEGLNMANRARSEVENTRSNLVSMLNATGDSSAASASALRQAQNLNMPQGFSPLGSLFGDFVASVGSIGSSPQMGYGGVMGGGGKALFSPSGGSMRVVGRGR